MDVAKTQRALWAPSSCATDHNGRITMLREKTPNAYNQRLTQALWGVSESNHPQQNGDQFMAFGSRSSHNGTPATTALGQSLIGRSPFVLDTLRPTAGAETPFAVSSSSVMDANETPARGNGVVQSRKKRVEMKKIFMLEAPRLLQERGIKPMSCGPSLAIALDGDVYLKTGNATSGGVELLTSGRRVSCVEWSPDGEYIALGMKEEVQIWKLSIKESVARLYHNDSGDYVTAIAWHGWNLLAANRHSIKKFDLMADNPYPIRYDVDESYDGELANFVTRLVWSEDGNSFASCGGGLIKIFDSNQRDGAPKFTLKHDDVQTIHFHPCQSSILVSAGEGGLKFWNVPSGSLRNTIAMEMNVTAMVWSPFRMGECVIASQSKFEVWSLSGKPVRIGEASTGTDNVLAMDCNKADGSVVCTFDSESIGSYYIFPAAARKVNTLIEKTGPLTSVIR